MGTGLPALDEIPSFVKRSCSNNEEGFDLAHLSLEFPRTEFHFRLLTIN